jgi:anti-sigma B factor antagonist
MCTVEVRTSEHGCRPVVALYGELDVAGALTVEAAVRTVANRNRDVILDLAGLDFIDCSGVATLMRLRRHIRLAGGDLLLAAPKQRVLRVLTVIRLIDVFSVHADVAAAAKVAAAEMCPVKLPGMRSCNIVATALP